ncbi:MAG: hypothetical protein IKK88_00225, partial [Oscillospiraceae bacterium]|nr:hypothetical protein [Oscillospiraceae bacterium]
YNNKNLIILVVNSTKVFDKLKKLASKIYNELDNIAGVGINFNPHKTNLIFQTIYHTYKVDNQAYVIV